MSAPITEAHLRLANQLVASPPSPLVMATLIADSEAEAVQIAMLREYGNLSATNESLAKERDQLRAEVQAQCLLNAKGSEREAILLGRLARAERKIVMLRAANVVREPSRTHDVKQPET